MSSIGGVSQGGLSKKPEKSQGSFSVADAVADRLNTLSVSNDFKICKECLAQAPGDPKKAVKILKEAFQVFDASAPQSMLDMINGPSEEFKTELALKEKSMGPNWVTLKNGDKKAILSMLKHNADSLSVTQESQEYLIQEIHKELETLLLNPEFATDEYVSLEINEISGLFKKVIDQKESLGGEDAGFATVADKSSAILKQLPTMYSEASDTIRFHVDNVHVTLPKFNDFLGTKDAVGKKYFITSDLTEDISVEGLDAPVSRSLTDAYFKALLKIQLIPDHDA